MMERLRRGRMVRIWYGNNVEYARHYIGWIARLQLRWEIRHGRGPNGPQRWEFDAES